LGRFYTQNAHLVTALVGYCAILKLIGVIIIQKNTGDPSVIRSVNYSKQTICHTTTRERAAVFTVVFSSALSNEHSDWHELTLPTVPSHYLVKRRHIAWSLYW